MKSKGIAIVIVIVILCVAVVAAGAKVAHLNFVHNPPDEKVQNIQPSRIRGGGKFFSKLFPKPYRDKIK